MGAKDHSRQYDLVVFGATGYTGQYAAEHITTHLPSNLKWALAGRSQDKLQKIAAGLKALNPDRQQPSIEVCGLNDKELGALASKTFVLISTVGPYALYGEHAVKACVENGTHYIDCTGEVPWTGQMINKYQKAAAATGAMLFHQSGVESSPSDLLTWSLAQTNRRELGADTGEVTISLHALDSAPSGGTLSTVFTLFDLFSLKEIKASHAPFALSPIPHPSQAGRRPSIWTALTGLRRVPKLGLMTTSIAGQTDKALVERSWGVLASLPSRKHQSYGPNFTWNQYMKTRNWLEGVATHVILTLSMLLVALVPPARSLLQRYVYQPGEGPDREAAKNDSVEYRGIAKPDGGDEGTIAFGRATFQGSMYGLTGIVLAEVAATILEKDDLKLGGGFFTGSCLGQPLLDRLDRAGFTIESEIVRT